MSGKPGSRAGSVRVLRVWVFYALAVLFFCLFGGSSLLNAQTLTRSVFDSGGGSRSGGTVSLSDSLGQPVPLSSSEAALAAGAAASVEEGFFGGLGAGIRPTVIVSPGFIVKYYLDWIVGVDVSTPAAVVFSKDMLASSLASAARVTLIRNDQAADTNIAVAVSTSYAPATRELSLAAAPPAANWDYNYTYQVVIDTTAVDTEGIPLESSATFVFQTRLKPGADFVVKAPPDPAYPGQADQTTLVLSPGAIPGEGHIEITTTSAAGVTAANAKFARDHNEGKIHEVRAVDYYDANNVKTSITFSPNQAMLYLKFKDLNSDQVIDGGSPASALVPNAKLYVLDETADLWVQLPDAEVSISSSAVYYSIPHLSYFAIGTSIGSVLNTISVYPSPFRPHGPNAGLGAGQTGTDAGGITFANLPAGSKVEVYTVRGERVWKGEEPGGTGKLVWDTRTQNGSKAASGVYLYMVRTAAGRKIDKLSIIR